MNGEVTPETTEFVNLQRRDFELFILTTYSFFEPRCEGLLHPVAHDLAAKVAAASAHAQRLW